MAWHAPFTQQLELAQQVLPQADVELGQVHLFCEQVFPPEQSLFVAHSTQLPDEQCVPAAQPLQPPQCVSVLVATQEPLHSVGAVDGQPQLPFPEVPEQTWPPGHIWVVAPTQLPLPLHFPVTLATVMVMHPCDPQVTVVAGTTQLELVPSQVPPHVPEPGQVPRVPRGVPLTFLHVPALPDSLQD